MSDVKQEEPKKEKEENYKNDLPAKTKNPKKRKDKSIKMGALKCIEYICKIHKSRFKEDENNDPDKVDLAEVIDLLLDSLSEKEEEEIIDRFRINELRNP